MSRGADRDYPVEAAATADERRLEDMYRAATLYYEEGKLVGRRCRNCGFVPEITQNGKVETVCPKCRANWAEGGLVEIRERRTQEEVAAEMSSPNRTVSRSEVQRLLKEAETNDPRIVHFTVVPPPRRTKFLSELEERVRDTFDLKKVLLVPGKPEMHYGELSVATRESVRILAAQRAAGDLAANLYNEDTVAFAWGYFVNTVLRLLPQRELGVLPGLTIVPTMGVLSPHPIGYTFEANTAVEVAAEAFQSHQGYWLPAPAFIKGPENREMVARLPIISNVLERIQNATVVVTGLALLDESETVFVKQELLRRDDILRVKALGAIADIGGLWYDRDGNAVLDKEYRPIGIEIEDLKRMVNDDQIRIVDQNGKKIERRGKTVMALAAGRPDRVEPILAAIRGKIINTLVSDSVMAEMLVQKHERESGRRS